jgi:uncharacterized membrane protein
MDMSMAKYVWAYMGAACVFVAADFVWLGFVARNFYRQQLGSLLSDNPSTGAAAVFYALYLVGVVVFGVTPGLQTGLWTSALTFGALFGFFAYATYDLTNLSTLRDWPPALALVDIAWGTALTAAAACGGFFIASFIA